MKEFINNNIKKIIVGLLLILLVVIIILVFTLFSKNKIKVFENKKYYLKYDNSWTLNKTGSKELSLKHKHGNIDIIVTDIDDNHKYEPVSAYIDDIKYGIEKDNSGYVLLNEEESSITSNELDGYKLLYENKDNQVLVAVAKQYDKIITFTYSASMDYFDILLDSSSYILNNFKIKNEQVNYTYKMEEMETSKISFDSNSKFKKMKKVKISNNGHTVEYEVPEGFIPNTLSTSSLYHRYGSYSEGLSISTSISISNMYKVLDKDGTFQTERRYIKNSKDNKISEDKVDKIGNGYVYRMRYSYTSDLTNVTTNKELVYIFLPLDNMATFAVTIEGSNMEVSQEIIDGVVNIKDTRYAKDIDIVYENGYLTNYMKLWSDSSNKTKYYAVKLMLPKEYAEVDNGNNKYEYRYFGLNYDEKKSEYLTNIYYNLTKKCYNNSRDKLLEYNKSYSNLKVSNVIVRKINNYTYNTYDLSYTYGGKTLYVKEYFHDISNEACLNIHADSNSPISDNIFNNLANYTYELKTFE